jgi:hypothetical protein
VITSKPGAPVPEPISMPVSAPVLMTMLFQTSPAKLLRNWMPRFVAARDAGVNSCPASGVEPTNVMLYMIGFDRGQGVGSTTLWSMLMRTVTLSLRATLSGR